MEEDMRWMCRRISLLRSGNNGNELWRQAVGPIAVAHMNIYQHIRYTDVQLVERNYDYSCSYILEEDEWVRNIKSSECDFGWYMRRLANNEVLEKTGTGTGKRIKAVCQRCIGVLLSND